MNTPRASRLAFGLTAEVPTPTTSRRPRTPAGSGPRRVADFDVSALMRRPGSLRGSDVARCDGYGLFSSPAMSPQQLARLNGLA